MLGPASRYAQSLQRGNVVDPNVRRHTDDMNAITLPRA
jgi:hypothetical protein